MGTYRIFLTGRQFFSALIFFRNVTSGKIQKVFAAERSDLNQSEAPSDNPISLTQIVYVMWTPTTTVFSAEVNNTNEKIGNQVAANISNNFGQFFAAYQLAFKKQIIESSQSASGRI